MICRGWVSIVRWLRKLANGPSRYNYPVFGRDAFRTATGVHAAAVIKSYRKGDRELADLVYSGVPAGQFGLEQVVEIGPMSGKSNVIYWLEKRGIEANEDRVTRIYDHAKQASAVLGEEEIMLLVQAASESRPKAPS